MQSTPLVDGNHGDLRALVRDLQVLSSGGVEALDSNLVVQHLDAGRRDMTTEVFPGMESLYRSDTAVDAVGIGRSIDKQPSDLMNWVHWNNSSLFDVVAMRRGSKALVIADRSVESRYRDLAPLIVLDPSFVFLISKCCKPNPAAYTYLSKLSQLSSAHRFVDASSNHQSSR